MFQFFRLVAADRDPKQFSDVVWKESGTDLRYLDEQTGRYAMATMAVVFGLILASLYLPLLTDAERKDPNVPWNRTCFS